MKKKFIIPMLAVLVAIAIAFTTTATAKVAPNRGNTPKRQSLIDTPDGNPERCRHYQDGWRCGNNIYYPCYPYCMEHCGG